tara:strand:+ start:1027 stop:1401 length:375 start_codon:yes stop_codon:yes gene_type:complete
MTIKNKLKTTIASGLTALVLASCATAGETTQNTEPQTEQQWVQGVTDTGSGYEGIACTNSSVIEVALTEAEHKARQAIARYVNDNKKFTRSNQYARVVEKRFYEIFTKDEIDYQNVWCVKVLAK